MTNRVPDRAGDGQGGEAPAGDGRSTAPDRRPETDTSEAREKSESEKAETEIAAGDVADDLADFA